MGKMSINEREEYDGSRVVTTIYDEDGDVVLWIEDGLYTLCDLRMENSPDGLEQFALKLVRAATLLRDRED